MEELLRFWLRLVLDSDPAGCSVFAFFTHVRQHSHLPLHCSFHTTSMQSLWKRIAGQSSVYAASLKALKNGRVCYILHSFLQLMREDDMSSRA